MDKIINTGQILVFEVSKQLSWHEYFHQAKLSRFGLAGLPMAAILDFQISISQPFEELQGWNLEFMLITPNLLLGTNLKPIWVGLVWLVCLWWPSWIFKCLYLSHLKSYRAEIQNLSYLSPKILLEPILTPNWECLVWQVCLWQPSWIFKCPYLSRLKSYRAEIQNLS